MTTVVLTASDAALAELLGLFPRSAGSTYHGVTLVHQGEAYFCALALLDTLSAEQLETLRTVDWKYIRGREAKVISPPPECDEDGEPILEPTPLCPIERLGDAETLAALDMSTQAMYGPTWAEGDPLGTRAKEP